jgi:hypothetical protein
MREDVFEKQLTKTFLTIQKARVCFSGPGGVV